MLYFIYKKYCSIIKYFLINILKRLFHLNAKYPEIASNKKKLIYIKKPRSYID